MKFATVFTFLTLSAASAYAVKYETNASRLARGLPPLPPIRRTSTWGARHARPSYLPGKPRSCNAGGHSAQCCNTVTNASDEHANFVIGLLGVAAPVMALVGLDCSPLSAIGIGGNSCAGQPVCCENNHFSGLVSTGCTPININA